MIPAEQCQLNWTAIAIVGGFAINIAGWFVVHFLTKRRERRRVVDDRKYAEGNSKKNRMLEFKVFLSKWRSEVESGTQNPFGTGYGTSAEIAYRAKIASFHSEVERARDAFGQPERFESLTSRLASLKTQDWDKKQPRDVILESINELIKFCEH
jgi:hypothetical protein